MDRREMIKSLVVAVPALASSSLIVHQGEWDKVLMVSVNVSHETWDILQGEQEQEELYQDIKAQIRRISGRDIPVTFGVGMELKVHTSEGE